MSKNIVMCFDGTANQFGKTNTNLVRLFQVLDRTASSGQAVFYDPGVGTLARPGLFTRFGKWMSKVCGLAFAAGLIRNTEEAVQFLMETYQEGDCVYLFGFSRGSYTARAVAGFLHKCGLPQRGGENLLPYFMAQYRRGFDSDLTQQFRRTFGRPCPIHFLGLWDTVSTLGWVYNPEYLPFTHFNPNVRTVRHAVALDERRCFYRANLWRRPEKDDPKTGNSQDVKEVWFAGVHSDVGGGYSSGDSELWKISFKWMIDEAITAGLKVEEAKVAAILSIGGMDEERWASSPMHKSLTWYWWFCEFLPKRYWNYRAAPPSHSWMVPLGRRRFIPNKAEIHLSVKQRIAKLRGYNPPI
jgi:uncharacterized protein (DUF2235 family)